MRFIRRCGISILAMGLLFAFANLFYFWRHGSYNDCNDCATRWGVPFPFRQTEGFATAPRFLWLSLMEDFALIFVSAIAAVSVWKAFGAKNSK
jgi:hypothetical protein